MPRIFIGITDIKKVHQELRTKVKNSEKLTIDAINLALNPTPPVNSTNKVQSSSWFLCFSKRFKKYTRVSQVNLVEKSTPQNLINAEKKI